MECRRFESVIGAFLSSADSPRGEDVRNLPDIAKRIANHRASISIRQVARLLERRRSRGDSTSVTRIGVIDVDIEKSRHLATRPSAAHHDERIADANLVRSAVIAVGTRIEDVAQESD